MPELLVQPEHEVNDAELETRFYDAVEAIELVDASLTLAEREELTNAPVCKPSGRSDQGYRFD